ncbi:hypothetical protein Pyn_22909 [Prunus yedoensis var. nudiflora]|uniref:Uncharacterized protein n=1 Tax=Prunus yedoensis var. nudiflora TaxID=2094558 RepID=A0A314YVA7_PRUYE|nr:hypothetical protein Pyn_22909 [Prunus yedoensis var. nudiflora]
MGWLDCDLVGLASISLSDLVKRQRGARGGSACVVSGMSAGRWYVVGMGEVGGDEMGMAFSGFGLIEMWSYQEMVRLETSTSQ